jgi:maltooligosyltrehalose trehalohydrolase
MMSISQLGAIVGSKGHVRFEVWAPSAEKVDVHLLGSPGRRYPMERRRGGYFTVELSDAAVGTRYVYRLKTPEGASIERPDPASRYQPDGVHGPSQVIVTGAGQPDDGWCGRSLSQYVIYELHVGTFTPAGTFDAAAQHLGNLAQLGVTAVELMPVAQFPGTRNWGYDGVYPYAVQNSYGGPEGLKRFVDACHRTGLAVILDVVYNHLGPEGNYLRDFGPYFTDFYRTPWGEAINLDGPFSDEVRRYFIENALQWIGDFHIDALRLDAVHAIMDFSARPFLQELSRTVHRTADALNRRVYLIAESALNDTRIIRPRELGGYGLDAQWNDDFHHSLHTTLTGESVGYYMDYHGLEDLASAWRDGYVYSGQHSKFRRRSHGNSSRDIPSRKLVVFAQNHDQVGNRRQGDRLGLNVSFEKQKLSAGMVLLSPYVPLIFMGEEYGETAPFLYFVDHSDPDLVEAVRRGRQEEFAAFKWQDAPPDPQDEDSYARSKLNHHLRVEDRHRHLLDFYRELLTLRNRLPALSHLSKKGMIVTEDLQQNLLVVQRFFKDDISAMVFNFNSTSGPLRIQLPPGNWVRTLDSADPRWKGPGSRVPESLAVNGPVDIDMAPECVILFNKPTSHPATCGPAVPQKKRI